MSNKYKFQDYEAVWQGSQASGNDLLLLLVLAKFRKDNKMYATRETIAELMNCNVDTVDRSIKRLRALGELVWDKGSNHSKRANCYRILLPGLDFDPNNTPLISPRNSPRNSRIIPPETHGKYPRNITPLNSNETVIKLKAEISVFELKQFEVLHMRSCDVSMLSPLQVWELMQEFAESYSCSSAYNDKVRLDRWWDFLGKAAASQTEGVV